MIMAKQDWRGGKAGLFVLALLVGLLLYLMPRFHTWGQWGAGAVTLAVIWYVVWPAATRFIHSA